MGLNSFQWLGLEGFIKKNEEHALYSEPMGS